jgi:ankyrin repeat protein
MNKRRKLPNAFNKSISEIRLLKIIAFALLTFSLSANAIVIRHDISDQKYIKLGQQYRASIVQIEGCTGTLIDKYWLLTAAHCAAGREDQLFRAGHLDQTYRIESITIHPNYNAHDVSAYDIALIQLKEPITNGKPAKLYPFNNEKGKQVVFVGNGVFGNGRDGLIRQDFTLRGATNTIVELTDKTIGFTFDSPQNATVLEGISGPGDSGGPAFVTIDSQLYVVGVSSHQVINSFDEAHYGVNEYYTRVSTFFQWVTSVIENTDHALPPPSHLVIDAIKANNRERLVESIDNEVVINLPIMNEALYQSVVLNRIDLAKLLISKGVETKCISIFNMSLFEFSLLNGRNDFFEMLLNGVKSAENLHGSESTILPLLIASFSDDPELLNKVKRAVSQGANINAKDNSGNTALLLAGWSTDNILLIRYLIESGANINESNKNGDTALMDAAYLDKPELLRYLLLSGADPSLKNLNGNSAMDLATNNSNRELILAEMNKRKKSL